MNPPRPTPSLVVWRQTPLDIEVPFYNQLTHSWDVYLAYLGGLPTVRRHIPWGEVDAPHAVVGGSWGSGGRARRIIDDHPGAIHVFYGLRHGMIRNMKWAKLDTNARIVVIAERPNDHGKTLRGRLLNLLSRWLYRSIAARTKSMVDMLLAMGERGVAEYENLGFPADRLFPFMYVSWSTPPVDRGSKNGSTLRCIYVGRMDAANKGVDVLLDSIAMMPGDSFSFDFVGNYGSYLSAVQAAAAKDGRIRHLGSWPSSEVVQRMAEYDVCIVPSRYDGWNVVVNHAINAGVPLVVTDDATSNDLVTSSGAGRVVRSGDARAIAKELLEMKADSGRLAQYRQCAQDFRDQISLDSVAQYFTQLMDFVVDDTSGPRPIAPWGTNGRP